MFHKLLRKHEYRISPVGTIEFSPGFQPRVYHVSPHEKSPGGTQEKKLLQSYFPSSQKIIINYTFFSVSGWYFSCVPTGLENHFTNIPPRVKTRGWVPTPRWGLNFYLQSFPDLKPGAWCQRVRWGFFILRYDIYSYRLFMEI